MPVPVFVIPPVSEMIPEITVSPAPLTVSVYPSFVTFPATVRSFVVLLLSHVCAPPNVTALLIVSAPDPSTSVMPALPLSPLIVSVLPATMVTAPVPLSTVSVLIVKSCPSVVLTSPATRLSNQTFDVVPGTAFASAPTSFSQLETPASERVFHTVSVVPCQ